MVEGFVRDNFATLHFLAALGDKDCAARHCSLGARTRGPAKRSRWAPHKNDTIDFRVRHGL
ncbi:MAG: hypothetical protein CO107_10820 [Deltaproteobacteria bacterium CG_4_9_14_3_um_filter_51_14]|nr:MAG: hypothetical protein CO107_10820 [Deltaproteobacteria bacterium CG_4_9_14_3_um_filter_51_14]